MALVTTSDLNNLYEGLDYRTKQQFKERTFSINEANAKNIKTVFLSHSHYDKSYIEKAVALLRKIGVDVYVDWLDKTMPETPNNETARKIKGRIKDSHKFVLLVSNNSIKSNWVNWELGFGDANKYIDHITMLAFVEPNQSFSGAEYLSIYPRIEKNRNVIFTNYGFQYEDNYEIVFPDGRKIDLKTWLNS